MRLSVAAGLVVVAVVVCLAMLRLPGDSRGARTQVKSPAVVIAEKPRSVPRAAAANGVVQSAKAPEAPPETVAPKTAVPVADDADKETSGTDSVVVDQAERNPLKDIGLQLRSHPGDITKLFEQLETETDPEKIALLAKLISENAIEAGIDLPVKQLLGMLKDPMAEKRDAALAILSRADDVTPEMINGVGAIARNDGDNRVRMSAISAMGNWLNDDSKYQEALSRELIQVRDSSGNNDVRGYAIQTVGLQKHGLPASMIEPMTQSLQNERNADNRSIAALALTHVDDANRASVVQALEKAYQTEADLDTRRHLVTMLMRTAGTQTATVLGRLNTDHQLLKQDVSDYLEIIGQGETDVNRIFELKNSRDGDRGTEPSKDPN